MITSPNDALMQELSGDGPLSPGTRAFLGARARNAFFSFIHEKLRNAKSEGLTQEKLAQRIGKDPGRLSNTLSSPGNWQIDTIALLLFAISGEELAIGSKRLLGKPPPNMRARDGLDNAVKTSSSSGRFMLEQTSGEKAKLDA